MLIGFGVEALVIVILWPLGVRVWKICIGQDKRVSTSKTIPAVWTLVVGAMLLALIYAYIKGHHRPLQATNSSGVVGQYALLFGGPLGSAILAKQIVSTQVREKPGVKPPATKKPSPTDLVTDDKGDPELGDLQYVLFNAIALAFALATMLSTPIKGIPHLPDVLLGLTSVSAVGYVAKKTLTPTGLTSASIEPSQGTPKDKVVIAVEGLLPPKQSSARFWVRFGDEKGELREAPVTNGVAQIELTPPERATPPAAPVDVTVVTADGTPLQAGSFTYKAS
ncbi:MAG: hypothetical protein ACHQHO_05150 [Solirubrobacterales bacterium]